MKKSIMLRVLAAVGGLLILSFLFMLYASFNGNPISAAISTSKIRAYVSENYPENFEVPFANYNFKDGSYMCHMQSKTSEDTAFSVSFRRGKLEDNYETQVTGKWNTWQRLDRELDREIERMIAEKFPYETRLVLGSFEKTDFDPNVFTLDMPFDLYRLPLPATVTVWCSAEKPSAELTAERLLELVTLMENEKIDVSKYSLSVEYPYHDENGQKMPKNFDSISVFDLTPGEIKGAKDLVALIEQKVEEGSRIEK